MNPLSNEIFDSDYRPNVGIMLVNNQHKVLAGEVIHRPGKWMMIDREFSLFEWVEIDWLIEHRTKFKKDVYRTIFDTFNANLS